MADEAEVLQIHLAKKNLRMTRQRHQILRLFVATERHLSTEDLYLAVRKKDRSIGYSTVRRMMKLLCECGLAREIAVGDGISRFEHAYAHDHHDHLICVRCGELVEVVSSKIEHLQLQMARRHKFKSQGHRLQIFGICETCRKRE